VLLIDEDLPEGIKNLLGHPQWSLKVAMLRGSGLRVHDLARAKVRTADGCFLITPRTGLSATNADHQTIMSAWTIRNYAPEVKLYVHILLPESKLHLNMADHVICEGELSMSMSSLNSVFPGLATLAALLAHTFTYEGRSVHHPEYQWYERCSPGEIYHGKLGDSQYFHHFVGKNFTFASVIAYRKFHVVLIGVKPAGSELIKFNPGIHHIMNIDDTCYYISETSEVNSDYQVIQPSSFQSGLWKTTAMLGLLGMYMSGIDLGDMFHQGQHFEDVGGIDQTTKLAFPRTNSHKSLQENMSSPHPTRLLDTGSNHGNDEEDHDELMDEHMAVEMTNWHHEAQLGIQLLHYHAQGDFTHKPCVKLSVKDHHHNHHHHYYGQFGRSNSKMSPIMTPHHFHHPLNIIPEDADVPPPDSVVVQKLSPNTRNRRFHGQMSAGPMGTSGGGNVAAPGNVFGGASHHHHHHVDHQHKLRSHLKLMVSHGDTASITSVASSTHSTKSEKSIHSIDDIVRLAPPMFDDAPPIGGASIRRHIGSGGIRRFGGGSPAPRYRGGPVGGRPSPSPSP
jgi:potassium channel subfamily T protein 1